MHQIRSLNIGLEQRIIPMINTSWKVDEEMTLLFGQMEIHRRGEMTEIGTRFLATVSMPIERGRSLQLRWHEATMIEIARRFHEYSVACALRTKLASSLNQRARVDGADGNHQRHSQRNGPSDEQQMTHARASKKKGVSVKYAEQLAEHSTTAGEA